MEGRAKALMLDWVVFWQIGMGVEMHRTFWPAVSTAADLQYFTKTEAHLLRGKKLFIFKAASIFYHLEEAE